MALPDAVLALQERGVVLPAPHSLEIDPAVLPSRIAPGVVLHGGCRLLGAGTSLGPGCILGEEAPATVENCRLGRGVRLAGGYYSGAVFLDGASTGSAAHIRPGTLLEERSSAAHAVGLKQTIFFPWVTAGSLINMCDCLMTGGTGPKDHSEIGSSYIHFNFTPHQDKATASLLGDVPRGVMLAERPIFLGGQGGLVGPARIGFGTVIPAGKICREDVWEEDRIFSPAAWDRPGLAPFRRGVYGEIDRLVRNNVAYIANLWALLHWYRHARGHLPRRDEFDEHCLSGAVALIRESITERVARLAAVAAVMPQSAAELERESSSSRGGGRMAAARQRELHSAWPRLKALLERGPDQQAGMAQRQSFLEVWTKLPPETPYLEAVSGLSAQARAAATVWLQLLVDDLTTSAEF